MGAPIHRAGQLGSGGAHPQRGRNGAQKSLYVAILGQGKKGIEMKAVTSNWVPFLVDDEDAHLITNKHWYAITTKRYQYVVHYVRRNKRTKAIYLHRCLLKAKRGQFVDHVNGDTLDNRRFNLRLATNQQNQWNQRTVRGKVPYKGVTLDNGKYRARIRNGKQKLSLGVYATAEDAANAYLAASKRLFGKFSV